MTEPEYVQKLAQELRKTSSIVTVKTVGSKDPDPMAVLSKAKALLEEARLADARYDWCCLVVDVDEHASLDECLRGAKKAGIWAVVSNLKFEVWLLWHHEETCTAFHTKELDRIMRQKGLMDGKHLTTSFPIAGYSQARHIAELRDREMRDCRMAGNPSSSFPVLLDLMVEGTACAARHRRK